MLDPMEGTKVISSTDENKHSCFSNFLVSEPRPSVIVPKTIEGVRN